MLGWVAAGSCSTWLRLSNMALRRTKKRLIKLMSWISPPISEKPWHSLGFAGGHPARTGSLVASTVALPADTVDEARSAGLHRSANPEYEGRMDEAEPDQGSCDEETCEGKAVD